MVRTRQSTIGSSAGHVDGLGELGTDGRFDGYGSISYGLSFESRIKFLAAEIDDPRANSFGRPGALGNHADCFAQDCLGLVSVSNDKQVSCVAPDVTFHSQFYAKNSAHGAGL